ncbi:MAG TPA: DUF5946 family protein [Anaerolineae bacterium]|jgi:hypothetical protein
MDDMVCPDCGARVAGGRNGCKALWDDFSVRTFGESRLLPLRDMAFDAYCLQHPARYCVSAKSYMAHLTRLCGWIDFNGDIRVFKAILRSLDGQIRMPRPEPPAPRWTLTISDIAATKDVGACIQQVRAWAADVWQTYDDQHAPAREWIRLWMK